MDLLYVGGVLGFFLECWNFFVKWVVKLGGC